MSQFDQKRKSALSKDKSNKGSIDKDILSLINTINKFEDYFTTSSCSGRTVIIKKVSDKKTDSEILYCNHDKLENINEMEKIISDNLNSKDPFIIWLRYESAIIHICCKDLKVADDLFSVARNSGFLKTGIISMKNNIIVEITGNEYFETILADQTDKYFNKKLLNRFTQAINKKSIVNLKKISNFENNLLKKFK